MLKNKAPLWGAAACWIASVGTGSFAQSLPRGGSVQTSVAAPATSEKAEGQAIEPVQEKASVYERTKDVPDAIGSTAEVFHHAAEAAAHANDLPLYQVPGGVAALESPIARLGGAAASMVGTAVTAADVAKASYKCGIAAQQGGIGGLSNCAGEAADAGTSVGVGLVAGTGALGTAGAAGYAVGKVGQQILSTVTGEPTLNDQWTDYVADKVYGSTSDFQNKADDEYHAKSGYSEQEINQLVEVAMAKTASVVTGSEADAHLVDETTAYKEVAIAQGNATYNAIAQAALNDTLSRVQSITPGTISHSNPPATYTNVSKTASRSSSGGSSAGTPGVTNMCPNWTPGADYCH